MPVNFSNLTELVPTYEILLAGEGVIQRAQTLGV